MTATIFKFPYDASRRVYSRRPRASKNGTPEERAAKAPKVVSAAIIDLSEPAKPTVDRRKLRGSPLRDKIPSISFAATIVGKMCTADLKGEDLPSDAAGWCEELRTGAATARYVADELDKAAVRLGKVQTEPTQRVSRIIAKYEELSPYDQGIVSDEIRRMLRDRSGISDLPVSLPVPGLGQSVPNVLNLTKEHDQ